MSGVTRLLHSRPGRNAACLAPEAYFLRLPHPASQDMRDRGAPENELPILHMGHPDKLEGFLSNDHRRRKIGNTVEGHCPFHSTKGHSNGKGELKH